MNIDDVCSEYQELLKKCGFSANTIYYYPLELKQFLEYINKPDVQSVSHIDFLEYRNHLDDTCNSKALVIKKMSAVKKWFTLRFDLNPQDAVLELLYDKISSYRLSIKKKPTGGYKAVPLEKFLKFLKTASMMDLESKLFVYLLTTTGGRSQFYGIELKNLNLKDGLIENMVVKGGKTLPPIPLVPVVIELIKEHLDTRDYDSEFLFKNGRKTYVPNKPMLSVRNMKNNTVNAERILKRISDKARVKKITPHQIRKTIATHGHKLGLTLEGTSDLLGHENLDITKKHYRGTQTDKVADELTGINAMLKELEN